MQSAPLAPRAHRANFDLVAVAASPPRWWGLVMVPGAPALFGLGPVEAPVATLLP